MDDRMRAFFNPSGVVVIGASRDKEKLGFGVVRNLIASGYGGQIGLVNPKGGELFGRPLYQRLDELPFTPELAILVIPAKFTPETLIACSQKGIKLAIIISGGFREAGPEGLLLEEKCKEIGKTEGMRIIGPNCIGVIDTHTPFDTTFIQPPIPAKGKIAFISQSGALGAAMIDWAREERFGFSQVVSLGNQIDVSEADMLEAAAMSEDTFVVTMYLESIQSGTEFLEKAARVTREKPVIAVKVGRSEAGSKAAASHTGALAGSNAAYDAAFRKSGLLAAESIEEMFEWAKAFAWISDLPLGDRVAVLTNAGGPGVTATDAIMQTGLSMANFSEDTTVSLSKILPKAASVHNPVDMLASASPEVYAESLRILVMDPNVDMVLVIAPPPPMFEALEVAKAILPIIQQSDKPVVVSFMGSTQVRDAILYFKKHHIPEYRFPERAVRALAALKQYANILNRDSSIVRASISRAQKDRAAKQLTEKSGKRGFLPAKATEDILYEYGIPTLPLRFADSEAEAIQAAEEIGFPVVMKLAADEFSHKSDVGGIFLDLKSADEVQKAFQVMMAQMNDLGVLDQVKGVNIQKMIAGGQEVIIGAARDPVFGPLLMFGSGGVEVEGLKDIQFSTVPPAVHEIENLLESTWAGKKLSGFRNIKAADINAVKDIFVRLSQLMIDHPEISEVEINPVIVMEKGDGAYAVDGRILI